MTVENGQVLEDNFDTYEVLRLAGIPEMEARFVESAGGKSGGLGEPSLPPVAPAVCNAVFSITGRRIRALPIGDYLLTLA